MKILPLLAALLSVGTLQGQTAAPTKPTMGSRVFAWEKLVARPTPNGERRDVANHATPTLAVFECHITTLNPGAASHEPHRHPQEELIIVKEGTLEVHINGQTQVAGRGSTFFYAANDAHRVRNVGATRATYWVINLASAATHTPALHNPASTLKSGVFDWEKLTVVPTKTGERRAVLEGSTVTLVKLQSHITTLEGGVAAHGAHRHPDEEIVLVAEGSIEATINGQSTIGGPGSVFFFASDDLHGMKNAGPTRARYHVIRLVTAATPKPAPAAAK
ncbi:MAG: cupin domain-containing protein [Opitutaceae bacterium]|nr:cupin domain-containing protein [Opitutaceae bacterium]